MMRKREYDAAWPTCPEMKRCHECGSFAHLACQSNVIKVTRPGWNNDYEEVNTCNKCLNTEEGEKYQRFEKETNCERTKRKKEEINKRRKKRKIKIMNGSTNMHGGEGPPGWESPRKGAGKGKDGRTNNQKAKARQHEQMEKMSISAIIPYISESKTPTREETIYWANRMWSINKTRVKEIVDPAVNLSTADRTGMVTNWMEEIKKKEP